MLTVFDNFYNFILFSVKTHLDFLRALAVAAGIFLLALLVRGLFTRVIFNLFLKLSSKTSTDVDNEILLAFKKPLKTFFVFLGLFLALRYLPLTDNQDASVTSLFRASAIGLLAWGFYNLSSPGSALFRPLLRKINLENDRVLLPFLAKILRFIIIALAISIIVDDWGFNVSGLVAGLGLGGLAVALAAQDAIGNIFGGIIIIVDKPFTVGDWIQTPSVEGTVEEVNFRSSKIRTFSHALVTIPNSVLANEAITNWTRMGKRRITFNLGVAYTTPKHKLENCVRRIRELLENHPGIHKETIFVRFDSFNESSLDIFLYFFTVTTNWGEYLAVKEEINFKILEILEQEQVSIAFPSRILYFENALPLENHNKT